MKQQWQQLADKIDAMTLRERALIFVMLAALLLTALNFLLLDPLLSRQKKLALKMQQEQTQMASVQAALEAMVRANSLDPDAANRARVQQLKQQLAELDKSLQDMQKGLVSHDRMPALLQDILRRNGQLKLVSLKTLPVTPLGAEMPAGASGTAKAADEPALVYQHGVELTVQGSYGNLVAYLSELEKLPWRMFWSKAALDAKAYPKVNLTLTIYTMSLDKAWLSI